MCEEQDSPYRDYVSQLEGHRAECHTLLAQLDEALENLQHLSSQVGYYRYCQEEYREYYFTAIDSNSIVKQIIQTYRNNYLINLT